MSDKVLIVEGRQDKLQIQPILAEDIPILCTNGTISASKLEELIYPYEEYELYAFFDEDYSGDCLRALMKKEYPEACHLRTLSLYKQVEATPRKYLARILLAADFKIHPAYLIE
ncbi:hypothetical protein [Rummeliibacillus pycnus]|uniref:hypothetical protein n=1 Tax=Rummeliibacillus pycnus TaxID=101070 RepID=UPI003D27D860